MHGTKTVNEKNIK